MNLTYLTITDFVNQTPLFECAYQCILLAQKESIKFCEILGKKNLDPIYTREDVRDFGMDFRQYILVVHDSECFGALHYSIDIQNGLKICNIHHVAVLPPFRRRGYAKALFAYVFEDRKDSDEFQIGLMANNLPALALYQSLGFKIHSHFMFKNESF